MENFIFCAVEAIDCANFRSLDKLLRVRSYVSRFMNNIKTEVILNDELSADEINASRTIKLKPEQSFIVLMKKKLLTERTTLLKNQ